MLILIEGIDKAGKGTVIEDLLKIYPAAIVFKNKIKPVGKDEISVGRTAGIYLGAYQLAKKLPSIVLFDRSHITEIVIRREGAIMLLLNLIGRNLRKTN